MISNSYFTGWACALVDSDSTAICLLPAGVISFLIPKGLKVCINIILSWGLLCFLLRCWLGFSLLWSFVVSWHIMVYWFVVDWFVVNSWVFIVVLKMIFRPMALCVGVQGSTYDPDFQFTLRSKKDSADIENAIRRQQAAVGETW